MSYFWTCKKKVDKKLSNFRRKTISQYHPDFELQLVPEKGGESANLSPDFGSASTLHFLSQQRYHPLNTRCQAQGFDRSVMKQVGPSLVNRIKAVQF
jgi:hypothetical protein